jgi:hypothetical protein
MFIFMPFSHHHACNFNCLMQLFILRKFIEAELRVMGMGEDDVYFCSLSSATVVYKGQLTPEQVRAMYMCFVMKSIVCIGLGGMCMFCSLSSAKWFTRGSSHLSRWAQCEFRYDEAIVTSGVGWCCAPQPTMFYMGQLTPERRRRAALKQQAGCQNRSKPNSRWYVTIVATSSANVSLL